MKKITLQEISATLYEHLWQNTTDDRASLDIEEYRRIMLTSGLISSAATLRNKWTALAGTPEFIPIRGRPDTYLADLRLLRIEYGKPAAIQAGEYIIKEAE